MNLIFFCLKNQAFIFYQLPITNAFTFIFSRFFRQHFRLTISRWFGWVWRIINKNNNDSITQQDPNINLILRQGALSSFIPSYHDDLYISNSGSSAFGAEPRICFNVIGLLYSKNHQKRSCWCGWHVNMEPDFDLIICAVLIFVSSDTLQETGNWFLR